MQPGFRRMLWASFGERRAPVKLRGALLRRNYPITQWLLPGRLFYSANFVTTGNCVYRWHLWRDRLPVDYSESSSTETQRASRFSRTSVPAISNSLGNDFIRLSIGENPGGRRNPAPSPSHCKSPRPGSHSKGHSSRKDSHTDRDSRLLRDGGRDGRVRRRRNPAG